MKGESLSDSVYNHLLDLILSMEIKPGDRIPEAKIASDLGISRTPIRDALRQLANDGIVNIYPKRFAEVASWDEETTRQIGVVRVQLDILAAKLAVYNGGNVDFMRMSQHSKLCLEAARTGDIAKRIKEDCAFHIELSVISKNRQLLEFQRKIYLKIEFLQSWRGGFLENPEEQYRQHEEIIEALMQRNSELVCQLLTKHNIHFHNLIDDFNMDFFI